MNLRHPRRPHSLNPVWSLKLTCCERFRLPQTTLLPHRRSALSDVFQRGGGWTGSWTANWRDGRRRAAAQNKLEQVWLQVDSISVYVSGRERESPLMKSRMKKREGEEKTEPASLFRRGGLPWQQCMNADKQHAEYWWKNAALLPGVERRRSH